MANYNGQNFTSFSGVNVKGTIALRASAGARGMAGTLSVTSDDEGLRAWQLPAKSGTLPIMGTFRVQLPANSTSITSISTIVTVPGIRTEDALAVFLNKGVSSGYSFTNAGGTVRTLIASEAGNGQVTLTFAGAGTTAYTDFICSFLAMR